MAKVFLVPIDLDQNELQNARIQNLSTAPSSPVTGQVYYDTDDNTFYGWTGSWTALSLSAEQIQDVVGAMFSGNTETGITVTYEDSDGTIDLVISALNLLPTATGDLSLGSNKITNLATPTAASDAATKGYVDGAINGLSWKDAVVAASTANVTIATGLENGDTLDGVTLATGDRVLLKDQTAPAENGIYVVAASGAAARAEDADSEPDLLGLAVFVQEGSTNAGTAWVLTTDATIVVNTTALAFAQFGAGSSYSGGTGIEISGNVINQLTYTANVGDNSSTDIVVTHSLGTRDVKVQVYRNSSPYDEVECDIERTSTNTVTLGFSTAPTTDQYRVTVGF
jgi:hypothetical protein